MLPLTLLDILRYPIPPPLSLRQYRKGNLSHRIFLILAIEEQISQQTCKTKNHKRLKFRLVGF